MTGKKLVIITVFVYLAYSIHLSSTHEQNTSISADAQASLNVNNTPATTGLANNTPIVI